MTFDEYQKEAEKTGIYPDSGNNYMYLVLGLVGEAGEVANIVKKIVRDDNGLITYETIQKVKDELGDVLWYIANVAKEFKLSMESIAEYNLEKVKSRYNNIIDYVKEGEEGNE